MNKLKHFLIALGCNIANPSLGDGFQNYLCCMKKLCFILLYTFSLAVAQNLHEVTTEFELDNGLRVIMVKQGFAPVISFNLMFDVGGMDEPEGLGGLAHMVEHMAFQGTYTIGSKDIVAELAALREVELLTAMLAQAENSGARNKEIKKLRNKLAQSREHAKSLGSPNAFSKLFDSNGAVGLNASTGYDYTSYVVSLPANRLELYARAYADVLLEPVFRNFYEERDVVLEERRQRSEDEPWRFLSERFLATAFEVHPYGRSVIGSAEEIKNYRSTEAEAFFKLYYHPNRAVLVLVGDVEPSRDIEIIKRYFGQIPRGPEIRSRIPEEPKQLSERRITVHYDAEPQMVIGFHKPSYPARDDAVLDVIDAILTSGRTSRFYKRLVTKEQLALEVKATEVYPASRDPNLFMIRATPRFPNTNEDLEAIIYEELEKLKVELVTERELLKVKNQVRADFIYDLNSSDDLADLIAVYELFAGGWENIAGYNDIIEEITAEEIMTVANTYFVPENRTVGYLLPLEEIEEVQ